MKGIYQRLGFLIFAITLSAFIESAHHEDSLLEAINDSNRNEAYAARDSFRHPYKTLSFFEFSPSIHVLKLSLDDGWFPRILAPYLTKSVQLSVTHHNPMAGGYYKRSRNSFDTKVESNPLFDGVQVLTADVPPSEPYIEPNSQDLVLTFRNLHNWLSRDAMKSVMQEAFNALKDGGRFGVVEHRAPEGSSMEFMKTSGYVSQSLAIKVAQEVGFQLVATSEINANSNDTADHPKGVWTLPPSYRLQDQNRSKYEALCESDRMTLLFK